MLFWMNLYSADYSSPDTTDYRVQCFYYFQSSPVIVIVFIFKERIKLVIPVQIFD